MPSAAEYRKQAEALYRRAQEISKHSEALASTLRGIELQMKAERIGARSGPARQYATAGRTAATTASAATAASPAAKNGE